MVLSPLWDLLLPGREAGWEHDYAAVRQNDELEAFCLCHLRLM